MALDYTVAVRRAIHDEMAWDAWFRVIFPRVYYILFRRTGGDVALSEELTQSAIERFLLYRAYDKVTTDDESVGYLARTALRLLADERRRTGVLGELPEDIGSYDSESSIVEGRLDLERLTEQLPDSERMLVDLLREDHSIREIAKILGINYSAAGVRIHRVKQALKEIANEM
jgi:RNA polymerase sigma factor (sigma-70 family)